MAAEKTGEEKTETTTTSGKRTLFSEMPSFPAGLWPSKEAWRHVAMTLAAAGVFAFGMASLIETVHNVTSSAPRTQAKHLAGAGATGLDAANSGVAEARITEARTANAGGPTQAEAKPSPEPAKKRRRPRSQKSALASSSAAQQEVKPPGRYLGARKRPGSEIVGSVEASGEWLSPAGTEVPVRMRDLWLARCLYAESNRPEEQELIAWVVRNRVETAFRGESTYRGVVLDPGQFTPFNPEGWPGGRYREYYLWLHPSADVAGWKEAMRIAVHVRSAPSTWRPFPIMTRHFFSQKSMPGQRWPDWAKGRKPVEPLRNTQPDPRRLMLFRGIPESA